MISNERVLKELSDEEGVRLTVYKDTRDIDTVGIGHNLEADPVEHILGRHLKYGDHITQEELDKIFARDVQSMEHLLDEYVPWWRDLPDFAQYVILSLCFNMGIGGKISTNPLRYNGLRGFPNTLKCFMNKDFAGAAAGLESAKWYKQVGIRGKKLCTILRTGHFPDGETS